MARNGLGGAEKAAEKTATYDLCGVGNAIVDVVAPAPETFLSKHDMRKGSMSLITTEQAEALYAAMPPGQESSGGSAANTCAVAAGLGARVAFLGKVADDALGAAFRRDIARVGVHFSNPPAAQGGAPTARSLILVTPDGQRTMNTYLGACVSFAEADLDEAVVQGSRIIYLEGYLFDPPEAQAAFRRAAALAREAGREVAISLSDAFCVNRHRAAFREFVATGIDILFANEAEVCSLYEENDFEAAARRAVADVRGGLAVLTRSEQGSVVLRGDGSGGVAERADVAAAPARVIDTTGAGDAYAAGFLAAYAAGRGLAACGRLGSLAAAEVIGQLGARPKADLRAMAASVA